jgi:hypothetical protein
MKKILTLLCVAAMFAVNTINAQQSLQGVVGDTVSLDLGTVRGNIQWEKSTDNSTYNSMSGETNSTLTYEVDVLPLYFRAIITENDCDPITSPYVEVTSSIVPPTVTTAAITNITQTSADGGGNVTADGGSNVIARGLCWSTSPNPTVNDFTSNAGSGTGTFTSSMSGLNAGTLYYVRAYAVNQALQTTPGYGNEIQFITTGGYQIGDTGPGNGKIFYLDGQGGGMEVALSDAGGLEPFGCSGNTLGASGTAVGTGSTNHSSIMTNCGTSSAANFCDTLTAGGQTDWVLPSIDELDSIYVNLVNIGTPAVTINTLNDYWSSSESGPTTARTYNFGFGQITNVTKTTSFRIRCVREF